jgi:hypothetical protein
MKTKSRSTTIALLAWSATLAVAEQWTPNTLPSGLIAWWQAEGDMLDSAGAHAGTGDTTPTYAAGRFGQAFHFDGAAQSVRIPDGYADLDGWTQFTLEAWVNFEITADGPGGRGIFSKVGTPSHQYDLNYGYQFGFGGNATQFVCQFNANSQLWPGFATVVTLDRPVPTNVWLHTAATYDRNAVKLYLNGVPLVTNVIGPVTIVDTASSLRLSKDDNDNVPFAGRIDDARIYNRALSEAEIARLFNGPLEPQTVWGLKTHDPVSQPPTTLFRLGEGGTSYTEIGQVRRSGSDLEADGLARSPAGELVAFQILSGGSQLISINPSNAVATVIGPLLSSRDIRGATFTLSGRLLAFDDAAAELVEVIPATGVITGAPVRMAMSPGQASATGDLVQSPDGSLLFAMQNQLFRLDARSGGLTLLLTDTNKLADGYAPSCAGLAWAPALGAERKLIAYEVSIHSDVYEYLPASAFARTQLIDNLVPSDNAGRGDLAAMPAARVELLNYSRSGANFTIATVCRGGLWAWVEFTDDLGSGNWQRVPNTLGWVPYTADTIATPRTWTGLPADVPHRFFRVATSTSVLQP